MVNTIIRTLLVAAFSLVGMRAAVAADPPQVERFDDWQMRCFNVKSASPCDVIYGLYQKKTGLRIVMVSIAYAPSKNVSFMQVALPLGIAVTKGATFKAGGFVSTPLEIRRCDRNGCFAELIAAPELIEGLLANADSAGSIEIVADGGKPLSLGLSLKGFSRAYDAMKSAAAQRTKSGR